MRKHVKTTACSVVVLLLVSFFALGGGKVSAASVTSGSAHLTYRHACVAAARGQAQCNALIATVAGSSTALVVNPRALPTGGGPPYTPAELRSAYNLVPFVGSPSQTVAIVDAFSNPNLASDLATYRATFGLPACTVAGACLKIVNQGGAPAPLPAADTGWGLEESLDVDMASATCPNCHILVVEANSASFNDLGTAVNEAAALGARQISNSYGAAEFAGDAAFCTAFYQHNNVAVTASSGDSGPGVSFPANCPLVIGVGGTTLQPTGAEVPWTGAGGGCSTTIARPAWQNPAVTGCANKAVSDVSAVADPNTGVLVYDTFGFGGFLVVGGTSASSPIIASVYALAGNAGTVASPASIPWLNYPTGCLFLVGGVRYTFQGGLGSPNGIGCF